MTAVDPRAATDVDKEIGARIRARRQELGFSQSYVGDVIGLTFQQLQKYETGENRVTAATLMRIADVLRTETSRLLPSGPRSSAVASAPRGNGDAMSRQLEIAFNKIASPAERRLVLELARRFGGATKRAPTKTKGNGRSTKRKA